MKAKINYLLLIGIISYFNINWDCNKKDQLKPIPPKYYPKTMNEDQLQVESYSPSSESLVSLDKRKEIEVSFNHPIVPYEETGVSSKPCFIVEPQIKGKFLWLSSRLCTFQPSEDWKENIVYYITVQKGLKSHKELTFLQPFAFHFKREAEYIEKDPTTKNDENQYDSDYYNNHIRIEKLVVGDSYEYRGGYDSELPKNIGLEGKFIIYFNHEIAPKFFESIRVYQNDTLLEVKYKKIKDENSPLLFPVEIKTKESLLRNSKISIKVYDDIESNNGKKLESVWSHDLETYSDFTLHFSSGSSVGTFEYDSWGYNLDFSNQFNSEDLPKYVKFDPPVKYLFNYRGEQSATIPIRNWDVKPGVKYKVTITPFKDKYGNLLKLDENTFSFKMPNRLSYSFLDHSVGEFSVIESRMKQRYPVFVSNTESLGIDLKKIDLQTILDFLSSKKEDSYTSDKTIFFKDAKQISWKTGYKENERGRALFDFSNYLTNNKGWLALRFNLSSFEGNSSINEQIIQATDLGMTTKFDFANAYIWLNSIHTTETIPNSKVQFYSKNNLLGTCTTNSEGFCSIPHKATDSVELVYAESKDDKSFVLLDNYKIDYVQDDSWKRKYEGQIFYDRKLYRPGDKMFFASVIGYRFKGEFKAASNEKWIAKIIDSKGGNVQTTNLTTSDQGILFGEYEIPLDAPLGHYHVNLEIDREIDHKTERNVTNILSDYEYYNSNSFENTFQVEEFRPVSFSVDVLGVKESNVGEKLNLEIKSSYLFGGALGNAPFNYSLKRYPSYAESNVNFPNYLFNKDSASFNESALTDSGYYTGDKGNLNFSGTKKIPIELKPLQVIEKVNIPDKEYKMSAPYSISLEASVKDVDDKSITKIESFKVNSSKLKIGLKSPANSYHVVGDEIRFGIIATNLDFQPINQTVEVRIIQTNWNSIITKSSGNSRQTKNSKINKLIISKDIQLNSKEEMFYFKPENSGDYTITVQEKNGLTYSRDYFYVYNKSKEYNSWNHRPDNTMEITSNKLSYSPGETAKILVKSPYPKAKAIVTVEREALLWKKTFDIENTSIPLEVPILENYIPNITVKVVFFSPRGAGPKTKKEYVPNEEDPGIPLFKTGSINLSIDTKLKDLRLDIISDKEQYKPRDKVRLKIKSEPNSEVSLSVADEAVLNLIGYYFSDPVSKFYKNWNLGVYTAENRRFLIRQYNAAPKGANPGGDYYNPEQGNGGFYLDSEDGRKDIRYTAFWKPIVKLDNNGYAEVEFNLPDNLTSFKIMGVVSKDGKYGIENRTFKVKQPLIIQKVVPAFIRPKDELKLGAIVINQTGFDIEYKVGLRTNLLKIDGKDNTIISLKNGERKEVNFNVSLDEKRYSEYKEVKFLGKHSSLYPAEIEGWLLAEPTIIQDNKKANLSDPNFKDKLFFKFPLKTEEPLKSVEVSGHSEKEIIEKLNIPPKEKLVKDVGYFQLSVANSVLIGLEKAFSYYAANPHMCAEQRSSAFLLSMSSGEILRDLAIPTPKGEGFDFKYIENIFLGEIGNFQNSDGGFKLWKDSSSSSIPYLSVYVTYVLNLAKQRGYKVDDKVYKSAIQYIREMIKTNSADSIGYMDETFSLVYYILSNTNEKNDSLETYLIQNQKNLSIRSKSYLLLGLVQTKKLQDPKKDKLIYDLYQELIKTTMDENGNIKLTSRNNDAYFRTYNSLGTELGLVLQALLKVDKKNPKLPNFARSLLSSKDNLWGSTSSTSNIALGLYEYRKELESKLESDILLKGKINGFSLKDITLSKSKVDVKQVQYPLFEEFSNGGLLDKGSIFNLSISTNSRYYYNARVSYTDLDSLKITDKGLEIHRHVYDLDIENEFYRFSKKVKNEFGRGKVYLVRLVLHSDGYYNNIVIEDPIPSNLEIVNTNFITERSELKTLLSSTTSDTTSNYWQNYSQRVEYREDRVVITQDNITSGIKEIFYLVRPVVKGISSSPAPRAKLMYRPEVYGRGKDGQVIVK
ncbi:MAG: alpha-2-macroglobulin family protein [Leptospiraceae bacterium]|nr:alpha-2-macroglobulin family protein [Leptospiraceae bacterium]